MIKDPHGPSPTSRSAHSWLNSYKTGIKLRMVLTTAAALIIGLLAVVAWLVPLPRSWYQMRPAIFFSSVILLILITVVVLLIKGLRISKGRKESLDLAFAELAETSARYTRSGRRYHGAFGGRRFDAYVNNVKEAHGVVTGGVYAGEHLELILDSNMKVRLRAGPYDEKLSKVGGYMKGDLTALKEEAPEGLIVYTLDEDWGRRILKDEKAAGLMFELLNPQDHTEIRNLSLWPGGAMLTLHRLNPANFTAQNVKNWFTKLADWVERLESLAPSERPAEASKWDNYLRGDRKRIFKIGLIIVLIIVLLTTISILGILWLLIRN